MDGIMRFFEKKRRQQKDPLREILRGSSGVFQITLFSKFDKEIIEVE